MLRWSRLLLSLVLSLSILTAGQATAATKGAAPAVGLMVLCTGTGPVVVAVDADGQPTAPPHHCPDCVFLTLAGLAPAGFALSPFAGLERPAGPSPTRPCVTSSQTRTPLARGPPVLI
ncbi:MAG: hypothetical protein EP307_04600 [Rhodobacteraceae bacterium]|nr:MAG: hypothetical protein EP307_04600 [Paracoccaceae bacterium]